ncbi:MAG: hypothetical protein NTY20_04025 [Candidatus Aenigmarchaeota archaeon]|nr:hypothetical protein [Candidatus Aenigmarchaeota archaeon]
MKPFLGFFVCWDIIANQEPPGFLEKFFKQKNDSEHYIPYNLNFKILSELKKPKRIIGGNAGNAAVTLSELGIPCILSCPSKPESLMQELSKHKIFLVDKGKEKTPKVCTRPEKEPAHIIFEMAGYRKIFTFDEVQLNFLLDYDFWNSLKNASYMFLSGFHTVPEKHKRKVREIADFLEKRKFKTHLELGFGKGLMKYGIKRLVDRNCIDSMGMNETEIKILGISNTNPLIIKEKLVSLLEKTGLDAAAVTDSFYALKR